MKEGNKYDSGMAEIKFAFLYYNKILEIKLFFQLRKNCDEEYLDVLEFIFNKRMYYIEK